MNLPFDVSALVQKFVSFSPLALLMLAVHLFHSSTQQYLLHSQPAPKSCGVQSDTSIEQAIQQLIELVRLLLEINFI
ncbi:hypothetical protein ACFSJ3_09245 [Corallincola platygyrae]|uniref:Uncharacterized protein n=1 Tax=Corallincola platygyrae TaxID=1193278 RepID=A0ABW4XMG3_9GAMM